MTTTPTLALLAALASLLPLCAVRAMNASSGALFFAGNATPAQEGGAIPIPLPGVLASVAVELPIHWNRIGVHLNETKSAQYWHQGLRDAPEATIRGRLRGERKGQRKERRDEGKKRGKKGEMKEKEERKRKGQMKERRERRGRKGKETLRKREETFSQKTQRSAFHRRLPKTALSC